MGRLSGSPRYYDHPAQHLCGLSLSEDMSGVYLTLNQGVTVYTKELGQVEGRAQLRSRAAELRTERGVRALLSHGFSPDDAIELRTQAYRGLAYEAGTIAYKLYTKDSLPLDEALESDLEQALQAYDAYLKKTDAIKSESGNRNPKSSGQPARKMFVSHSHTDNEFCRAFVAALREQGMDVWYDEQGLSAGAAWVGRIQQELESREVFVLVATPAAWASRRWETRITASSSPSAPSPAKRIVRWKATTTAKSRSAISHRSTRSDPRARRLRGRHREHR
jgi:hypothetical protein